MKNVLIIILAISFFKTPLFAEGNDPCEKLSIPVSLTSEEIIFEIPLYDEYVLDLARLALLGETVEDKHIISQTTFQKIRNEKLKAIKKNYKNDYVIMTSAELKAKNPAKGFIVKEVILNDQVSPYNSRFETYTSFVLCDAASQQNYTLVNPSNEGYINCINSQSEFEFIDILNVLN